MSLNTAGSTNLGGPVRRLIAINGSTGAYVLISASIFAGYAEVVETPSEPYAGGAFVGQGLNYQRSDENYEPHMAQFSPACDQHSRSRDHDNGQGECV